MLDEWRQRFLEDGEVEVRISRRTGGLGMLAGGLAFGVPGVYFLVTPGVANPFGLGPSRVVGALSLLMGSLALACGLRMIVRPLLLLRLDPEGLETAHAPHARWQEIEGARTRRMSGLALAEISLGSSFWERVEATDPKRTKRLRSAARGFTPGAVVVPAHAPGSGEAVVRLVLWAREEVDRAS